MRRHAVILVAAAAWLIGIEGAEAKLDILVDKATQRMLVIQDGYMRYIWPVSTGRDEMATPNGVYAPQRLERSWFSSAYYNSPMPYSIFFHNGYAIHGSFAINQLGGPASHGCVRLHPHHAALLFDMVQQEGPANTTIEITDEARPEQASLPGREIVAPGRAIAAGRGGVYPPVTRIEQPGDMPELPPALRGNRPIAAKSALPPRQNTTVEVTDDARPDEQPLPGREIGAGRSSYPPPPRIVRYREPADPPEPPTVLRGNRPIVAKNALPLKPPPPQPAGRHLLADVRSAASPARATCGGEADNESPDCRPKPKVVLEAPPPEQPQQARSKPKVAEGSSPEQPQPAPAVYGFKLLPSSCWSGGASRWRWWGSGQGTPCR
jgi:hypothetical protein